MKDALKIGGVILGAGLLIASGIALAKGSNDDDTLYLDDFDEIDEDADAKADTSGEK